MIKQILYPVVLTLGFLFLLSSCHKDDDPLIPINRVLLVYMGADNNLSGESFEKIDAIQQGYQSSADTRILVYQDTPSASPRLFEIGGETIETYEPENSADASVFRRVIQKAKSLYPQAKFNLLVFSHASGWLPANTLSSPRSIIVDGSDQMELVDFAAAIDDHAFEYIIFEACFMSGIEVAYELRHKADYILASSAEIVSPGFTDVYRQHINELVSGDPFQFMNHTFDYFDKQSGYMRSATFSMIETKHLEPLSEYIRTHCNINLNLNISDIQYFDRNLYHLFFDFEDYYSRLLNTDEEKLQLKRLIESVVAAKYSTDYFMVAYNGFVINQHSGLTTYIYQDKYPMLNEAYRKLSWTQSLNQ